MRWCPEHLHWPGADQLYETKHAHPWLLTDVLLKYVFNIRQFIITWKINQLSNALNYSSPTRLTAVLLPVTSKVVWSGIMSPFMR